MYKTISKAAFGALLLLAPCWTQAATVYVDKSFGPGGDGSYEAPYDTIQEAIDDFNSDVIIVYPGTYTENILITKNLAVRAYDGPHTTIIDGSMRARDDSVTLNQKISAVLEGFHISSGRFGVIVSKGATLRMRNCVVCGNDSHGLVVNHTDETQIPNVIVYNCIFVGNGGSGVYVQCVDTCTGSCVDNHPGRLTMLNTILVSNQGYGLGISWGEPNDFYNSERITLNYNNSFGNQAGTYDPNAFCSARRYSCGAQSISVPPEFVGGTGPICNIDFRLTQGSPCVDNGDPGMGWLDPDGTPNDIGAYGGPGAQLFYTNPNDGPIVRDLHLPQGMVPQGETFTIRATAAVREQTP